MDWLWSPTGETLILLRFAAVLLFAAVIRGYVKAKRYDMAAFNAVVFAGLMLT